MLCGSAFKNKGVQAVLDAVVFYLPCAVGSPRRSSGVLPGRRRKPTRTPSDKAPFAAFAFKIATDPAVGSLTFFRVYSGVLRSGDAGPHPASATRSETVGRLRADARERAHRDRRSSRRRHRRCRRAQGRHDGRQPHGSEANVITLEMMEFPEPVIAVGHRAEDGGGSGADGRSRSRKLVREDPTLRVARRRGVGPDDPRAAWASCISRSSSTA